VQQLGLLDEPEAPPPLTNRIEAVARLYRRLVLTFGAQILVSLLLIGGTRVLRGLLSGGEIGKTGAASFGALVWLPLITLGIITAATAYELAKYSSP
jgi:hypothetical protein